jgi:hypothetical protein
MGEKSRGGQIVFCSDERPIFQFHASGLADAAIVD